MHRGEASPQIDCDCRSTNKVSAATVAVRRSLRWEVHLGSLWLLE